MHLATFWVFLTQVFCWGVIKMEKRNHNNVMQSKVCVKTECRRNNKKNKKAFNN